jgi:hypothetical protein
VLAQPATAAGEAFDASVEVEADGDRGDARGVVVPPPPTTGPPSNTGAVGSAAMGGAATPATVEGTADVPTPTVLPTVEVGVELPTMNVGGEVRPSGEVTHEVLPQIVVRARRVTVGVELLTSRVNDALRDENSRLRRELADAQLEVEFLRDALEQLSHAKRTGLTRVMRATTAVIREFAIAAAATIATAPLVTAITAPPTAVEVPAPEPERMSLADLVADCNTLEAELDALAVERLPEADVLSGAK